MKIASSDGMRNENAGPLVIPYKYINKYKEEDRTKKRIQDPQGLAEPTTTVLSSDEHQNSSQEESSFAHYAPIRSLGLRAPAARQKSASWWFPSRGLNPACAAVWAWVGWPRDRRETVGLTPALAGRGFPIVLLLHVGSEGEGQLAS